VGRPPLTYRQTAEALAVSYSTVRRWVAADELPVSVQGSVRRVPAAAVERFWRDRTARVLEDPAGGAARVAASSRSPRLEKGERLWDHTDPLP
jgi:excisionase family DNA binding protein